MTENSFEYLIKQDHALFEVHKLFEWDKWIKEIPAIPLKFGWSIRVIPPFGGAIVRFCVIKNDISISVYLDCYGKIGFMAEPYWEIYPSENGEPERFFMNEIDELSDGIQRSFKRIKKERRKK